MIVLKSIEEENWSIWSLFKRH